MSNLMMELAMMKKQDYFNEFKGNDKIRVIFGYKNEKKHYSDDYFEMSIRVWIGKEYFDEFINDPKVKNNMEVVNLFLKTPFFKELEKQTIKIDFKNWDFIVPSFFKKHNIKIIPYFQLGNDEDLTPNQFFSFEEEYKFLHKR